MNRSELLFVKFEDKKSDNVKTLCSTVLLY